MYACTTYLLHSSKRPPCEGKGIPFDHCISKGMTLYDFMIVHVFALLCCCTVEFLHRGLMCLAWMLCHPLGYLWVKLSPDLSAMQTWFSPTLGFWQTAFYKMFGHLLNSNECCRFLTILMLPWISLVVSLSLVFSPDIIWHLGHLQSHNFHQLPSTSIGDKQLQRQHHQRHC